MFADTFDKKRIIDPEGNKQELIALAKSGAKRPSCKTKLGRCLRSYTNKGSSYDKDFDKLIRSLRHDWFINQSEKANAKKQELIRLAKSGAKRPSRKTNLGQCLCHYTHKGNSYDKDFDKLIRSLRPDWFNKIYFKKQELIKLAKSGAKKPDRNSKIGDRLRSYLRNDKEFAKLIRSLRPDWFKK
jgi:hypothetical protein